MDWLDSYLNDLTSGERNVYLPPVCKNPSKNRLHFEAAADHETWLRYVEESRRALEDPTNEQYYSDGPANPLAVLITEDYYSTFSGEVIVAINGEVIAPL
jgi:hypothetical protein